MLYVFKLDYVKGGKIVSREKKFQATDDNQAKIKAKNKWIGASKARRRALLIKAGPSGKQTIESWVTVSH